MQKHPDEKRSGTLTGRDEHSTDPVSRIHTVVAIVVLVVVLYALARYVPFLFPPPIK